MSNGTVQAPPARHLGPSPFAQPFALSAQYSANRRGEEAPAAPSEAFTQDLGGRLICRDCDVEPPNLVEDFASGDLVCGDCGLVIGDIIDTQSKWRTSANEEGDDASRVGQANQSLMDGLTEQLDTRIATNAVDLVSCFGDYLALDQATMVCVRDVAEQVRNVGLLAGRSPVTVAAACIFMTTTLIGEDVTPSAIGNAAGVSVFTVSTSFRHLVESTDQILTSTLLQKHPLVNVANLLNV